MRIIDEIGRDYPGLDMESLRILLVVSEHPGFCIREVADILQLSNKRVQEKITIMAKGRKNRNKKWSRLGLINVEFKVSDRRKRDLMLTDAGEHVAAIFAGLGE